MVPPLDAFKNYEQVRHSFTEPTGAGVPPPVDSSGGEESGDCADDEVTDAGPVLRWTVPSSTSLTAERTRGLRHIVPERWDQRRRRARTADRETDELWRSSRVCTLYFPT